MNTILAVERLSVCYGDTPAVRRVSFHVRPGELFGIIGESGSGKSTICRAVMGDLRTQVTGRIQFGAHDMTRLSDTALQSLRSRHIAFLPQGVHALNPLIRVGDHITETLRTHLGERSKTARKKAVSLLKAFFLPNADAVYDAFPYQLSGGMARRAIMAITFACGPKLVVADEPTRGLDTGTCKEIMLTLQHTVNHRKTAVLMITHDLKTAGFLDRIAVLRRGRLVETGSAREVLETPRHPYTRALMNARPATWRHRK